MAAQPRTLLVGSPDNVAEKVQELQEVCNLDYLLVEFTHPGIPFSEDPQEPGEFRYQSDAEVHRRLRPCTRARNLE